MVARPLFFLFCIYYIERYKTNPPTFERNRIWCKALFLFYLMATIDLNGQYRGLDKLKS